MFRTPNMREHMPAAKAEVATSTETGENGRPKRGHVVLISGFTMSTIKLSVERKFLLSEFKNLSFEASAFG